MIVMVEGVVLSKRCSWEGWWREFLNKRCCWRDEHLQLGEEKERTEEETCVVMDVLP